MNLAPIVLFVYNRPLHLEVVVNSLKNNRLANQSDLIIFSDASKKIEHEKNVDSVRKYIKQISGFKSITIIEQDKNLGLANSVIAGVTKIVGDYGKVIVLEDDLLVGPYFLEYMNEALCLYENYSEVGSINGYVYPVRKKLPETFFLYYADCWGWGTWKRSWDLFEPDAQKLLDKITIKKLDHKFNFDGTFDFIGMLAEHVAGRINSWAIRWEASLFLENKLSLYPHKSLVINIGGDCSGTHSNGDLIHSLTIKDVCGTNLHEDKICVQKIPLVESELAYKEFSRALRRHRGNTASERFVDKIKKKLSKLKFWLVN